MMAKWYQYFSTPVAGDPDPAEGVLEHLRHADGQRHRPAGPTPQGIRRRPVRLRPCPNSGATRLSTPTSVQPVTGRTSALNLGFTCCPDTWVRVVDGDVDVVVQVVRQAAAAIRAVTPTKPSMSIAPYPMDRTCDSLSTIFGVVPDDTSEWNPLTAPHMTQMNTNGNSPPPLNVGPPFMNTSFRASAACSGGLATTHAADEQDHGADLQEAAQVVSRAEQQPHRQHGGHEPVDDEGQDGAVLLAEREDPFEWTSRAPIPPATTAPRVSAPPMSEASAPPGPCRSAVHPEADEQGDGDRAGDGERAPRRAGDDSARQAGRRDVRHRRRCYRTVMTDPLSYRPERQFDAVARDIRQDRFRLNMNGPQGTPRASVHPVHERRGSGRRTTLERVVGCAR